MASTIKFRSARGRRRRRDRDEIIVDALLSHRGKNVPFDALQQGRAFMRWLIEQRVSYEAALQTMRAAYLQEVISETKGNICAAARLAGVHRNTMTRLLGREE